MATTQRPGIEQLEVYFPAQYVDQQALEVESGVSSGKFTKGLGQLEMSFCTDLENIHSVALTVVSNLMAKSSIKYSDIGRLSVSSETILDKSKSIKSVLMQLFEHSKNHNVEGVDYLNACYGGTAGLFDAINWVASEDWDGRYALVVCVDIAEYEAGPARPTGGIGAVAMLIGPKPVVSLEFGRASYMKHVYDFYKPYLSSPYPVVDGKLSNSCFIEAIDECYEKFAAIMETRTNQPMKLDDYAFCIFHSPYNKLVQKSYGRLVYNDFLRRPEEYSEYDQFQAFRDSKPAENRTDRNVINTFSKAAAKDYESKVGASTFLPKRVGNGYTASLYMSLASLMVETEPEKLLNQRILAFSYGSGLCSSMFHLRITSDNRRLCDFQRKANYNHRLQDRVEISPDAFNQILADKASYDEREEMKPKHSTVNLYPGTFYVLGRTAKGVFSYCMYDGQLDKCNEL